MHFPMRVGELRRCPPPSFGYAKDIVEGRDTIPAPLRTPLIRSTGFSGGLLADFVDWLSLRS